MLSQRHSCVEQYAGVEQKQQAEGNEEAGEHSENRDDNQHGIGVGIDEWLTVTRADHAGDSAKYNKYWSSVSAHLLLQYAGSSQTIEIFFQMFPRIRPFDGLSLTVKEHNLVQKYFVCANFLAVIRDNLEIIGGLSMFDYVRSKLFYSLFAQRKMFANAAIRLDRDLNAQAVVELIDL